MYAWFKNVSTPFPTRHHFPYLTTTFCIPHPPPTYTKLPYLIPNLQSHTQLHYPIRYPFPIPPTSYPTSKPLPSHLPYHTLNHLPHTHLLNLTPPHIHFCSPTPPPLPNILLKIFDFEPQKSKWAFLKSYRVKDETMSILTFMQMPLESERSLKKRRN